MTQALPASIDATSALLAGGDYVADRPAGDGTLPRPQPGPPAVSRRRGRRRQDRDRQGAGARRSGASWCGCNATRGWTWPRRSTSGTTSARCWRSGSPRPPGTTEQGSLAEDIFTERFLIRRPLLQALEAGLRRPAGAADRRARPHRRAVRGLPARGAVRLPDHHPRARHHQGRAAADRDHHQQPHARDPRRAQAPLLLPLGRLPHGRARAADHPGPPARRRGPAVAPDRGLRPGAAPPRPVQAAGRRRDPRLDPGADHAGHAGADARPSSTTRWAPCSSTRTTSSRCRAARPRSSWPRSTCGWRMGYGGTAR